MAIVRHILDKKGQFVWTIRPDDTVLAAIEEMARKDVAPSLLSRTVIPSESSQNATMPGTYF